MAQPVPRPVFAILAIKGGDDMMVVDQLHPQGPRSRRRRLLPEADAPALVGRHVLTVDAQPEEHVFIEEQQQAALGIAIDLDLDADLVGLIADVPGHGRAVGRSAALALQSHPGRTETRSCHFVGVRIVEGPARAESRGRQVVGTGYAVCYGLALRLAQRLGQITADRPKPAVRGPRDRFQQGLAAQGAIAVFIAVIDHEPGAARPLDQGGVTARPPFFGVGLGMNDRVMRVIFPGTVDRFRAGGDDHVTRRRTRCAANRADKVKIIATTRKFRTFEGVGFDDPVVGVLPAVIDLFDRPIGAQTIVAQADALDPAEKQVALAILSHRMARIDGAMNAEIDRLAPRTHDGVGVDDADLHHRIRGEDLGDQRDIDEVATPMLDQVAGKNHVGQDAKRRRQGLPVDQVARMPNRQGRIGFKGAERHVIVVAILQDGRIGTIAGHDGIEIGAVAEIAPALPLDASLPAWCGRFCRRLADGR